MPQQKKIAVVAALVSAALILLAGVCWFSSTTTLTTNPSQHINNLDHFQPSVTVSKPKAPLQAFAVFAARNKVAFGVGVAVFALLVVAVAVAVVVLSTTPPAASTKDFSEQEEETFESAFGIVPTIITGTVVVLGLISIVVVFAWRRSERFCKYNSPAKQQLVDVVQNVFSGIHQPVNMEGTSVTITHNQTPYTCRKLADNEHRAKYYEFLHQRVPGLFLIAKADDDNGKNEKYVAYTIPDSPEFEALTDEDAQFLLHNFQQHPIVDWTRCNNVNELRVRLDRIRQEIYNYPVAVHPGHVADATRNFVLVTTVNGVVTKANLHYQHSNNKAIYRHVYGLRGNKLDFYLTQNQQNNEITVCPFPSLHDMPIDQLNNLKMSFTDQPTIINA